MNIYTIIQSQYLASLEMLRRVVEACPENLWNADKDTNRFWLVAYHAIFYTHLYAHPSEADFTPWEKGQPGLQFMGRPPEGAEKPDTAGAYTKGEILEYITHCRQQVTGIVPGLDLHGPSGFDWLPLSKLELQFYNIRHLMLHTGELSERLWVDAGLETGWVGRGEFGEA